MPSVLRDTRHRYKFLRNLRYVHCTRYALRRDMLPRQREFGNLYHIEILFSKLYRICEANISRWFLNQHIAKERTSLNARTKAFNEVFRFTTVFKRTPLKPQLFLYGDEETEVSSETSVSCIYLTVRTTFPTF